MVKVGFFVLIHQTFKAFMRALKYTLFEGTKTRLTFSKLIIFQEF